MNIPIKQLNYFFIGLVILWQPIQLAFLNLDAAGRFPIFISLVVLSINLFKDSFFRETIFSKPIVFWLCWILFSIINLIVKGYTMETPSFSIFIFSSLFIPFIVMLVALKETVRNPKNLVSYCCIIYLIYSVLSVTLLGKSNNDSDRGMGLLWNGGPLTAQFVLFFLGLMFVNGWIKIKYLLPISLFVIYVIALASTRKAFAGALIIITSIFLSQIKFTANRVIPLLLFIVFVKLGFDFVLANTALGERFKEGLEVGEKSNTSNIELLNFVGDRAIFYIEGWQVFLENSISGIGLMNFMKVTGNNYVIHSEYIVQFAEGGMLGVILFFLFYFSIGKELFSLFFLFPNMRPILWILIGAFTVILFTCFTTWIYSFPRYFIVIGVILGYMRSINILKGRTRLF